MPGTIAKGSAVRLAPLWMCSGWPSFFAPIEDAVRTSNDYSLIISRTEVHCPNGTLLAREGGVAFRVTKEGG
jgi:hypothetical protein